MPKGRRNTPNRLATRRSIALESGGSPGLALVGAPAADDLKVVLDPGLDLAESVGDIASELVRAVAAARTPLDAELALSPVLGMLDRLAPPDAAPEPRAAMVADLLGGLIAWAQAAPSAAALALLRVIAALGGPAIEQHARSSADLVAASGIPDRPWATSLGGPELIRAWWYGDVYGEQESVALQFDYHHREHTLCVLIDHELGGGVKDCWIAPGHQSRQLHDRTAAQMADNPEAQFKDIDATRALKTLQAALTHPPCPVLDDQIEDVTTYLPILRARVTTLARSAR